MVAASSYQNEGRPAPNRLTVAPTLQRSAGPAQPAAVSSGLSAKHAAMLPEPTSPRSDAPALSCGAVPATNIFGLGKVAQVWDTPPRMRTQWVWFCAPELRDVVPMAHLQSRRPSGRGVCRENRR